jgi:hypothetical protein
MREGARARGRPDVKEHDHHPATYGCIVCGMTYEDLLDFPGIDCEDARAAQLPGGSTPAGRAVLSGSLYPWSDQVAHQRGLMLDGLYVRARRQQRFRTECEAATLPGGVWSQP